MQRTVVVVVTIGLLLAILSHVPFRYVRFLDGPDCTGLEQRGVTCDIGPQPQIKIRGLPFAHTIADYTSPQFDQFQVSYEIVPKLFFQPFSEEFVADHNRRTDEERYPLGFLLNWALYSTIIFGLLQLSSKRRASRNHP